MSVVFFAIRVISSCDSIEAGGCIDARPREGRPGGSAGSHHGAPLRVSRHCSPRPSAAFSATGARISPAMRPACVKPNESDIYAAFRCRQKGLWRRRTTIPPDWADA
jgi:hypothetical protein